MSLWDRIFKKKEIQPLYCVSNYLLDDDKNRIIGLKIPFEKYKKKRYVNSILRTIVQSCPNSDLLLLPMDVSVEFLDRQQLKNLKESIEKILEMRRED